MSIQFRPGHRVFVYGACVDMRFGYNKLSLFVREKIKADIVEGDLFLFIGRNRKLLKAICYDGSGLVLILISKRMEHGKFMSVDDLESLEITEEELHVLLHGSIIRRVKFGKAALTQTHKPSNLLSYEATPTRKQS